MVGHKNWLFVEQAVLPLCTACNKQGMEMKIIEEQVDGSDVVTGRERLPLLECIL